MSKKGSSDGSSVVGGFIFVVIVLIAMVPKPVWITLGIVAAAVLVTWIVYRIVVAVEAHRAAEEERERVERAQQAAAQKREREERARKAKQRRIDTLGKQNAARVESTLSAVQRVKASEAARTGWLGEVDFSADIKSITENFEKAHALRAVTSKLSALDKPNADDKKILDEAKTAIAALEGAAIERVTLIEKCATEAQLIDKTLRTERDDARIAAQRAELHGKLSGMLYGIEAAPPAAPSDSAAAAVMARVQAYREIKSQIERAREDG
ncbi:hypothetical protein [Mycolicibacterium gilvum]|uniref:Uncharacterized protein n=1 Tax=Mycolicibacterium gilvum TaxID=1804 RepID=A0A378SIY0_9MYCO|nr:hypothetical protein [Mycolicibacterium gilvum]MCV7056499.1 hypothetical protein [Mycolicibacterium gilvum]STZ41804.1 Uncharacterised protein [Mycolicibacterium gilvum]